MRKLAPVFLVAAAAIVMMAASSGDEVLRPRIAVPPNPPALPGLRGPESLPQRPTITATPSRLAQPRAASARTTIASTAVVDAHQCRAACAEPYYFCLAGGAPGICPDEWRRCVVACDWPATSEGAVEPVTGPPPAR